MNPDPIECRLRAHKWYVIRLCIEFLILSASAALLVAHIAPLGRPSAPLQGLLAFWLAWAPCACYILRIERTGPSHE